MPTKFCEKQSVGGWFFLSWGFCQSWRVQTTNDMVQDIVYSSVVAQEVDNGKAIITFLLIFHHHVVDDFIIEVALKKNAMI